MIYLKICIRSVFSITTTVARVDPLRFSSIPSRPISYSRRSISYSVRRRYSQRLIQRKIPYRIMLTTQITEIFSGVSSPSMAFSWLLLAPSSSRSPRSAIIAASCGWRRSCSSRFGNSTQKTLYEVALQLVYTSSAVP